MGLQDGSKIPKSQNHELWGFFGICKRPTQNRKHLLTYRGSLASLASRRSRRVASLASRRFALRRFALRRFARVARVARVASRRFASIMEMWASRLVGRQAGGRSLRVARVASLASRCVASLASLVVGRQEWLPR